MRPPKTERCSDSDAWHWTPEQSVAAISVADKTVDLRPQLLKVHQQQRVDKLAMQRAAIAQNLAALRTTLARILRDK
jgi:hypothetical protein